MYTMLDMSVSLHLHYNSGLEHLRFIIHLIVSRPIYCVFLIYCSLHAFHIYTF